MVSLIMKKPARYMDAREVADYICSTILTVRAKTSRREIPYIKVGRRVLYDRQEIDAWLATQKISPTK